MRNNIAATGMFHTSDTEPLSRCADCSRFGYGATVGFPHLCKKGWAPLERYTEFISALKPYTSAHP